jgi:hypothetical protein
MNAIYPSRRFLPLKARAMIDYVAHEFALDPRLTARLLTDGASARRQVSVEPISAVGKKNASSRPLR